MLFEVIRVLPFFRFCTSFMAHLQLFDHFICKFHKVQYDSRCLCTAVVEWSYFSYESDKVITTVEAPLYLT